MKKFILFILLFSASLHAQNTHLSQLVYQIRNPQTDSHHFRRALEKIGEQLGQQVYNELDFKKVSIVTLTGAVATHSVLAEIPVLVTILRAGLPLNQGVHKVFPQAEVGFLAMSRDEETLKAKLDYVAIPDLTDRTVILTDTMLATGGSILDAVKLIQQYNPKRIFVISAIAAVPGIERIQNFDPRIKIFAAAIDPILNEKGYIVPGLGDAGDRAYGFKHFLN